MRSTTRLAAALGVTLALALTGIVDASAAPKRGARNDSASQSAQAKATPQEQAGSVGQARGDDTATSNLLGYSARPEGKCWERQGGGGHDLSGYWKSCSNPAQR